MYTLYLSCQIHIIMNSESLTELRNQRRNLKQINNKRNDGIKARFLHFQKFSQNYWNLVGPCLDLASH